jgi:hypothetical protein
MLPSPLALPVGDAKNDEGPGAAFPLAVALQNTKHPAEASSKSTRVKGDMG